MRIFFAGPLTNLTNPEQTKSFYTKMGEIARQNGFDYYWAFQRGTDPEDNPEVPPSRVFQIDTYELEKSDLVIAYVGQPSIGTGEEVEYARDRNIPVYLMFEKNKHISRMLLGTPNVKGTIAFENEEDALKQLDDLLKSLRDKYQ